MTRFSLRAPAGCVRADEGASTARAADSQRFGVDVRRLGELATVLPRGDLDLVTVTTLQAALDRIESARRVVLDLRRVSFLDSARVHLLTELLLRAQRGGFELSMVPPPPPADLAIELCGLYGVLPFAPGPRDGHD